MSKQEIVKMQEATKLAVAQINASKDANQSFAEAELQALPDHARRSPRRVAMQGTQQAHDQQMAQMGAQQDQQSQQSDQAHEVGMAGLQGAQNQNSQAADQSHELTMAQQSQRRRKCRERH